MEKRTSVFENALIWFGAAVSIAEIITGTYLAPLGFSKGLLSIIIGHIIGCLLLFLAGLIGGKLRKSSMETVGISFGKYGVILFSVLNIIQLLGWTSIMIFDGALAANNIWAAGKWFWCIIISLLIIIWIVTGIKRLSKLNTISMIILFLLSVFLSFVVFKKDTYVAYVLHENITFGTAVELSVSMPLSWLPLISDYTREAKNPVKATGASVLTYGTVSCWMYIIGMQAAIYVGDTDIANIMQKAGAGICGLLIIVFSTVTTTFLDAYSAGVSGEALSKRINSKWLAVSVTVAGMLFAIFLSPSDITDFLYFIGSVFAPMIAIQIVDFFIFKKTHSSSKINLLNLFIWVIGFLVYRILMKYDIIIGSTLPDIVITGLLCVIANLIMRGNLHEKMCNNRRSGNN